MPLATPPIKSGSGEFELAPAGNHLAVCYGLVDLGTHYVNTQFKQAWEHKILLMFELSDELMKDGRPFSVSQKFNFSMHEKANLRQFVESWFGKKMNDEEASKFNWANLIESPGMLTVVHNPDKKDPNRVWANINGISPLNKRIEPPQMKNNAVYFVVGEHSPDTLPEWIKKQVLACRELAGDKLPENVSGARSSSLPADGPNPPF